MLYSVAVSDLRGVKGLSLLIGHIRYLLRLLTYLLVNFDIKTHDRTGVVLGAVPFSKPNGPPHSRGLPVPRNGTDLW